MAATFTVETGAGLSNANSYVSVADADQYHDDFGAPAAWTGATEAAKQAALRAATQYLDAEYGWRWKGVKANETQALDWPRYNVDRETFLLDSTVVPTEVEQATALLALKNIGGTALLPDIVNDGAVARTRVKVGPIEEETEYVGGKGETDTTTFALVEGILAAVLQAPGMAVRA